MVKYDDYYKFVKLEATDDFYFLYLKSDTTGRILCYKCWKKKRQNLRLILGAFYSSDNSLPSISDANIRLLNRVLNKARSVRLNSKSQASKYEYIRKFCTIH